MKSCKIFFYDELITILKKSLKTGQATLEYFILLALMLGITLVAMNPSFLTNFRTTLQGDGTPGQGGYSKKVADKIINPGGLSNPAVLLPPPPTSIPTDIPYYVPPEPGTPDPIKKTVCIGCPGQLYATDQYAKGEKKLHDPLELKPGDGILIKYESTYATTDDLPNKLWQIKMTDANPETGSDFDILVKYAGENCEYGPPTAADYDRIINDPDFVNGAEGFYLSDTGEGSGEDKDVQIHLNAPNTTGCIYIMVINTGDKKDKVNLELKEAITNESNTSYNPYAGECFKEKNAGKCL